MKTFRSFIEEELTGVAPKSKGEHKFVHSTYMGQIKDPGDLEKVGPEEIGPHDTKLGQGKRRADRLDNKQKFGEEVELEEEVPMAARALYAQTYAKHGKTASKSSEAKQKAYDAVEKKHGAKVLAQLKAHHESNMKEEAELDEMKSSEKPKMQTSDPGYVNINGARVKDTPEDRLKHYQKTFPNAKSLPKNEETDFSKSQTTMAHAIGKHFKKKGVGDQAKGGPFAVASAMVRDKPEAAKKAYATIKAKMKNEDHQDALMSLYDDLSEDNQDTFINMLEIDADKLLEFALRRIE